MKAAPPIIRFTASVPSLFDRSEVIGEGKQARLDFTIDAIAQKGHNEAPPSKPQPMPGQTSLDGATS